MGNFSKSLTVMALFAVFLAAGSAMGGAPRCDQVFNRPGGETPRTEAERALENRYWQAQYYLFKKISSLVDQHSVPFLTRFDVGPFADLAQVPREVIKRVPLEEIRRTQSEWEPFARMQDLEWNSYTRPLQGLFANKPYLKTFETAETKTPDDSPIGRALPRKLREKYARLFRPRYEFAGGDKTEQSVDVALHMAFSALRSQILRAEESGTIAKADLRLLKGIFFDGWKMKPIRFARDGEFDFSPDPASPHRLVLTGDEAGSPIVFHRDRLKALLESRSLSLSDLSGLLVHELVHHRGLKDDEARTPDRLGALITKLITDSGEVRNLDPDGRVKLHLYKWGYRPKQMRNGYEATTFSLILEDGGRFVNVTPYIRQNPAVKDALTSTSLLTLRDFDVKALRTASGRGVDYEVEIHFQRESTVFDKAAYERDNGPVVFDRHNPTEAELAAWDESGGFANPKYQRDQRRHFVTKTLHFKTEDGAIRPQTLLIHDGEPVPAEWSAAGATLSVLTVKPESPGIYAGQVMLKGFEPPPGARLGLVARQKGVPNPPLLGPVNALPVTIEKATKTPEGLKLEFHLDDRIGSDSRAFEIGELIVNDGREQAILPVASGVTMNLPAKILRAPYRIKDVAVTAVPQDPTMRQVLFEIGNGTGLRDAVLFLEVNSVDDGFVPVRKLVAVDLRMGSDPRARDAWDSHWLMGLQTLKAEGRDIHRAVFDTEVFAGDPEIQSVRVHSLFLRDGDLRSDFVGIPGTPEIYRK